MNNSFATVLNCMDGRAQVPVTLYLLERFGVDFLDTITEAGIVRYLSDETDSPHAHSTLDSIGISLNKHGSRQIAIVAHGDCAGNPIPDELQQAQVHSAMAYLKQQFPHCEIYGLWIDGHWEVHEIASSTGA